MKSAMNNQTFYLPKSILRPCGIEASPVVEGREVVIPAVAKAAAKKTTATTVKKDKAE